MEQECPMGGHGSGRWRWHRSDPAKPIVEKCGVLDVRELYRRGALRDGQVCSGTLRWRAEDGVHLAIFWIEASAEALRLRYVVQYAGPPGQKPEELACLVRVVWTPCTYGGKRPWFLCPGMECGRRVAKLYLPRGARDFRCRHCHGLTYASCRMERAKRLWRRAQGIQERLGGPPGLLNGFPPKPARVHWVTYLRLLGEYEAVVREAMAQDEQDLARLLARLGRPKAYTDPGNSLPTHRENRCYLAVCGDLSTPGTPGRSRAGEDSTGARRARRC